MKKIKTGADSLIELIQENKRISLDDASKILGANKELVREWGEFLEKEKLITINYSFSKVFFTERKFTSSEAKISAKEIVSEKDGFLRKVEHALNTLDKEAVNFNDIKKKFNSVQGEVKDEVKVVEKELSELEKYDELKTDVDKQLESQKKKFEKEIDELGKDIDKKESNFLDLYKRIVKEKEKLSTHQDRFSTLKKSCKELDDMINSASAVLVKLKDDLHHEENDISKSSKSLEKLNKEFEDIGEEVLKEKEKKIETIKRSLEKSSSKILEKQDSLLKDARSKTEKLKSYGGLAKKIKGSFEGFFEKILRISKKIDEIDKEKYALKNNYLTLHKKIRALNIINNNESLKKQAKEIEEEIKKQEEAKNKFMKKIRSILDDLRL